MAIVADGTAPFLDVADPGFSVRSAEVHQAREASWYARTSYGLAVLLRARPELGPAAVEEVMRISPTTTWVTREAIADSPLTTRHPAGTTIHLFCEPAGTDPRSSGLCGVALVAGGAFRCWQLGWPPAVAHSGGARQPRAELGLGKLRVPVLEPDAVGVPARRWVISTLRAYSSSWPSGISKWILRKAFVYRSKTAGTPSSCIR